MASYANLTIANIKTKSWDNMFKFFKDDSSYGLSTDSIFSSFNDRLVASVGYPIVIINPPTVSVNNLTMAGALSEAEMNFKIDCYHDNSAAVKALADELYEGLYNGRGTFATYKMRFKSIDTSELDMWIKDGKKLHKITVNTVFRYVGN